MRTRLSRLVALTALLAFCSAAMAGEVTDQIRQTTDKILVAARDPALQDPSKAAERRARIAAIAEERFDWAEMAQRAAAASWKTFTDAQKKEFVPLFRSLIENTYMDQIEGYSGEVIKYGRERVQGNFAAVEVTIVTRKNVEIPVEYRAFKKPVAVGGRTEQKWLIYDIVVENVGLVGNYREQIRDILARGTFEDLVKKLRAKLAERGTPAPTSTSRPT